MTRILPQAVAPWKTVLMGSLLLGATGCADPEPKSTTPVVDADGDGFGADEDCDDDNASVHPDADELCDGIDNNCDGTTDDAAAVDAPTWFADADGDGFGDASSAETACAQPPGTVTDDTDCDDSDGAALPGGVEVCDGVDNDCSGVADDNPTDGTTWYADTDGDRFGDPDSPAELCGPTDGWVEDNTDCDDTSNRARPGGTEVCDDLDNDCDGTIDWGLRVPTDYAIFRGAIYNAEDGDIICVGEGTHVDDIDFDGKNLTIESTYGLENTIVQGTGAGPVVTFQSGETSDAILRGLRIKDGRAATGAGIYIKGASPTIQDVQVIDAQCNDTTQCAGTGVAVIDGGLTMRNSRILYSDASDARLAMGAGLYAENADVTLWEVIIHDGRMEADPEASSARLYGAGLYATASTIRLIDSTISSNSLELSARPYSAAAAGGSFGFRESAGIPGAAG